MCVGRLVCYYCAEEGFVCEGVSGLLTLSISLAHVRLLGLHVRVEDRPITLHFYFYT